MAFIKCKYCNKKIDANLEVCPKCKKTLKTRKKNLNVEKRRLIILLKIIYILVQIIFCFMMVFFSKNLLYSGHTSHLFILLSICIVLLINWLAMVIYLIKKRGSGVFTIVLWYVMVGALFLDVIFTFRVVNAFRYENSRELLQLSEHYSVKDAKKIKKNIEKVFEYDIDEISSRNISIGNFYESNGEYILYLDDLYGNYRLKFYLSIGKEYEIINAYWVYDEYTKLYLVENAEKTEEFEYYYAMCIVNNIVSDEIKGLATIEEDVQNVVKKNLDDSANAMFVFDELSYNEEKDEFFWQCEVQNMNYYGYIEATDFVVEFSRSKTANKRKVWYYGDSSFDYVNWFVKM